MPKLQVTPLTTSVGARIEGIDLKRDIPEEVAAEIRAALAEHSVLVFGNQFLDDEQQKKVAGIFGQLEPAPSRKLFGATEPVRVIERTIFYQQDEGAIPYAPRRGDEYQGWHCDDTFCAQIPFAATLRPLVIPASGGDTCWASMGAAFDALSPPLQQWLESLNAIHAAPPNFRATVGFYELPKEVQKRFDEQEAARLHPVVVRHPVTGRKLLFVNPAYTATIEGLNARESANILRFLFAEAGRADRVYRHHWEMGDLVIWDELATLHAGPDNFAPERKLVRIYAGLVAPTPAREPIAVPV
jgi:taurine dioxygenase